MLYLGLLLAATAATLGLTLLRRLHAARADVRLLSRGPDPVKRRLDAWLDDDLLAGCGPGGFSEISVPFREAKDAGTVADLIRTIAGLAQAGSSTELLNLIKSLYELQYTLGIPAADFEETIRGVADRLRYVSHHGSPVARVQVVREGDIVDRKTLSPLNAGNRVLQPFGVVLYDGLETVLHYPKVLCR